MLLADHGTGSGWCRVGGKRFIGGECGEADFRGSASGSGDPAVSQLGGGRDKEGTCGAAGSVTRFGGLEPEADVEQEAVAVVLG